MAHVLAKDLREAILQAAVQGKLSKKEETDSSIETIIESLHFDAKIEKNEEPYDIPVHWRWIQIGNLGETNDTSSFADGPFGSNLKKEHQINQPEVRIIQLSNIGENGWIDNNIKYTSHNHLKTISRCEVKPGDFVIAKMMPAGRTIIVPEMQTKIVLGSDAVKFVPNKCLNKDYLLLAMKSNCFLSQVYSEVHGITRVRTSLNKIKSYYIPLPPIEEQARIVAKVDELMAKIDEYEKLEKELTELKEKFPEEIRDAILRAAFKGELNQRTSKTIGINEKDITKPNEDFIPFDIPFNWKWCCLKDVAKNLGGFAFKSNEFANKGTRVVRISDFNENGLINNKIVRYQYSDKLSNYLIKNKDILMCMTGGTVGKNCYIKVIEEDLLINQRVACIRGEKINTDYLNYIIKSPFIQSIIVLNKNSTNDNISMDLINGFPIPLPPIEEQQRIVDKLDKLLLMCDELANLC